MNWPALIVGLVALERGAELIYARRNTRALLHEGAYEIGRSHYPLIVLLHTAWLVSVYRAAPPGQPPIWFWIAVFLLLQIARYWVIATLGRSWTTRIIVIDEPLIRRGPYRFLAHPNYMLVAAEVAIVPLALGLPVVALVFTLLNGAVLTWRIHVETQALAGTARRPQPQT